MHAYVVAGGGGHVLSDEVGADRELAVSAVHEYRQAYGPRTSVVHERIHRRTNGAAGEKDIVDQDDDPAIDGEGDLRFADDRRVSDPRQIVALEGDVDGTEWNVGALVRPDGRLNACRERITPRADADDGEMGKITITLDDLVRDPRDGPADIVRREQRGRPALLPGLTGPVVKGGGAVSEYRFDDTALRRAGTVPAVT